MDKIHIRKAKIDNINQVAQIYCQSFDSNYVNENWNLKSAKKLISFYFCIKSSILLVAEINKKVVGGFAGLIKPWFDGNHLVDTELFVAKEHRKLGIGKLLLKEAITTAIDKYKISKVEGATFSQKVFPMSWYKKIGFKKIDDLMLIEGNAKDILKKLSDF